MTSNDKEAFIALIAPIGIDMNQVISVITEKAAQIRYHPNVIKLTEFFSENGLVEKSYKNEVERYEAYIKAGDDLCEKAGRGDILSLIGVAKMLYGGHERRRDLSKTRTLNIIRQIKRLDEYNTLERIYGRNIIFVGCYSSIESRKNYLVDRMRFSNRTSNTSKLESDALKIISIDEDEADKDYGQKIIDCYPKSDFILDCTSRRTLEDSCERLFKIYFGHPFVSPTMDEYSSYIANAAAYRSLARPIHETAPRGRSA
ncbi:hypothetical protein [Sphingobium amiense]|nr:hypothetical protein [Sphingobium amiense]